jgi:hypothetical protein
VRKLGGPTKIADFAGGTGFWHRARREPPASAASDDARGLAEDAFAYTPLWPTFEREEREQYVLFDGPNAHHLFGLALRVRAGAGVETIVEEVRAWFAERGRSEFTWLVADSSTPRDLRERLIRLGAQPDADEPGVLRHGARRADAGGRAGRGRGGRDVRAAGGVQFPPYGAYLAGGSTHPD